MSRFQFGRSLFARVRKGRPKTTSRLHVEPLEARANPVTAVLSGSTLIIAGDNLVNDLIAVRQTAPAAGSMIEVYDGRISTFVPFATFNRSAVTAITVDGLDGNDFIDLNSVPGGRLVALDVPATVTGGNGSDSLAGGSVGDSLVGGAGNDVIFGN